MPVHVCFDVCMSMSVYEHMCVNVHVSIYVCVCKCIYTYTYMYILYCQDAGHIAVSFVREGLVF